ncbi:MAG: glycoside hydrolase family 9 protein [Spirochaetales bacterium]|nr:glycoside hydrolase family 9 protein [Spirochaetales bacterium]
MKKIFIFCFLILAFFAVSIYGYNYYDALEKGLWFFDANRCGPNAGQDNVFSSWRGACHTNDFADGYDLTGGYHDAGDHVKFGLPQTWSAAMLEMALYEYRSTFDAAGVTAKAESVLKYFTDFFLKGHPRADIFWYGVGDGNADHGYWGPPENQTGDRPARSAPPGADVCGEAAAALALHYLNFGGAYGNQCLQAAKEIYNIGIVNGGRADDGSGGSFYRSTSHYDDLGWGGIWLSIATGDESYLDPIDGWLDIPNDSGDDHYHKKWSPAWDDVHMFVMLKMAELTGIQKYLDGVKYNLDWYRDDLQRTPYGLPWLDSWGVLRYASNEAGLGYLAYKLCGYNGFVETGNLITDYCLGDNPRNGSYVTNYLNNPPKHPHHRANEPNRDGVTHGMIGALVGGPNNSDGYTDSVGDYTMNEVAIDYNAAFIIGMAGRAYFANGGTAATPAPTPTPAPSTPPGTGDGLLGEYYSGTNFSALDFSQVDAKIDINWGGNSPGGDLSSDNYSVRWTGTIESRITETYTFYIQSDDGNRLYINNQLVIDDWNDHAASPDYEASGQIDLEMGGTYDIRVEYYESGGDASIQMWWSNTYLPREIVPQSQLYSAESGNTAAPTVEATPSPTPDPNVVYKDPNAPVQDRVADLLSRMSLAEKIGQMTQADSDGVTTSQVTSYYLGSVLSGGNAGPSNAGPSTWADFTDNYQQAAMNTPLQIPLLYGIDAVHGNAKVYGATVFPHNIGLGCTRDADLLRRIGEITAKEIAATGIDWTFGPCVAVARDERWSRTFETFGEDNSVHNGLVSAFILGLQGDSMGGNNVLGCAKHYIGDGGTTYGTGDPLLDQGDCRVSEAELRSLFLPPYIEAINQGVGSIMTSFSLWNGVEMSEHRYLITDVLKNELGFKGFVISDWDAINDISTDYRTCVRESVNAGIDMFMVPGNWQTFISDLVSLVNNGEVSMSRIDDAVMRILTVKFTAGLFENPLADRNLTNDGTFGSSAHRDVAREAVRKSMVLLKNNNVLPLSKNADVFVAGKNAHNIGNQCGGWTMSWQGLSGDIIPGTTILEGIQNISNGNVTFSESGTGANGHDVAIVVIGETPYSEGNDSASLSLDSADITCLNNVANSGIPMVVITVSGRPLMISDRIGSWDAFIAAWWPGTEGQGVAEVLFGDYDFSGTLTVTWSKTISQIPQNNGDPGYDPLFAFGAGMTYGTATSAPTSPPEITPLPANLGDVNNDGSIDIVDALLVAQYYVDLNPVNFDSNKADTNCDGQIDIVDALLVAQFYVGLITDFC